MSGVLARLTIFRHIKPIGREGRIVGHVGDEVSSQNTWECWLEFIIHLLDKGFTRLTVSGIINVWVDKMALACFCF